MIRIISWNIGKRREAWRWLENPRADVALPQEVGAPPEDAKTSPFFDPASLHYNRRPLVVQLSERVKIDWFKPISLLDKAKINLARKAIQRYQNYIERKPSER